MVPTIFSLGNPGNGIAAQARAQAAALQRRGHEVLCLSPWDYHREDEFDVLHFFLGGMALEGIENHRCLLSHGVLVMSPIIDSNQWHLAYRLAAVAGLHLPKFSTVPGLLATQARGSDIVICRSAHERDRVVKGLGVRAENTVMVQNGVDPSVVQEEVLARVRKDYELPERFVLHVSAYTQARKNALRLTDAVDRLGLPLILAGHAEPGHVDDLLKKRAKRNSKLRLLGFVDRLTRDALYHLCHVFCLPSIHEGTGLAALEAGAAGAHVVITRNGGTTDYFGTHAEYVTPADTRALSHAIARVWEKPRAHTLADHIKSQLTWDASAAALEDAYLDALARKRGLHRSQRLQ
jgi:glycosyltransferase involved in cell wall biosynthesis